MQNSEIEPVAQPHNETDKPSDPDGLWARIVCCKPFQPALATVLVAVAVAAALVIDCRVAVWCTEANCPDYLKRLLYSAEPFGHGTGLVLVMVSVFLLDPRLRCALPRLFAMSAGAGLLANMLKLLVARARPLYHSLEGGVLETFGGWLPFCEGGSSQQSFPSAHTATAVGLAVGLGWLYPRGRWLFAVVATLVALQRIESGYHYLSDTVCGAAIGLFVAFGCLNDRRLSVWFGRLERFLAARQAECSADGPTDTPGVPPKSD